MFQRILMNYRVLRTNTCMTPINAFVTALGTKGLLDPDVVDAQAHGRIRWGSTQ